MAVFTILSLTALRYVASGAMKAAGLSDDAGGTVVDLSQKVVSALTDHFTDHSQRLTKALATANERSWKTLEVALAGESFWDRCKTALSSGEDKALAQQVRGFLDRAILAEQPDRGLREDCLAELRAARKAGVLGGGLDRATLEREAGSFARYADPLALLDAEWRGVEQVAEDLRQAGYTRLGQLLRLRSGQRLPLLAVATCYFFRRAVEKDGELARGLTFAKLEALADSQEQNFRQVANLLERHSGRLEELLEGVQAVVVDTHGGVQRIEQQMVAFQQQISELNARLGMRDRQVRSTDTRMIRNEEERRLVREMLAQYRALPESERRQRPGLLSAVARLENAAGEHEKAVEDYRAVATLTPDDKSAQAEAHYNAYRAALERASGSKKKEDWDEALTELIKAVNRDRKYLPFDARKYQPQRILGAGGFGVTFLCKRRGPGDLVAVKSLSSENLDRETEKVLDEGRLLGSLDHSAIIRMIDCDYADPDAKTGPYLVMDYFDGQTLEEYVRPTSLVPVDEAVSLFRLVAEGMAAAHAKGVWHRDIKPANLLVRREPTGWRGKIIDFGLALRRELTQAAMSASTSRQGKTLMGESIAGTVHYAAPEQMDTERQKEIGPWSDIYGFGKTCYYALFGTPTPDDDDKDGLPDGLKRLLSRCTSQVVGKRPQSFTEVVGQLKEIEQSLIPTVELAEPVEELEVVEEDDWYYNQSGKQAGPVAESVLRRLIESGHVKPTDHVWRQGFTDWVMVKNVGAWKQGGTIPPMMSDQKAKVRFLMMETTDCRLGKKFLNPKGELFKVYADGKFRGEGYECGGGIDTTFEVSMGRHCIEVRWWYGDVSDEKGRKTFEVGFLKPGDYTIRFNFVATTHFWGDDTMEKSTLEILSEPE
jgi:serine/threonine protein kinase